MGLNWLDLLVFGVYILPSYVIGTSIVATVVSTEHFIAQVGAA